MQRVRNHFHTPLIPDRTADQGPGYSARAAGWVLAVLAWAHGLLMVIVGLIRGGVGGEIAAYCTGAVMLLCVLGRQLRTLPAGALSSVLSVGTVFWTVYLQKYCLLTLAPDASEWLGSTVLAAVQDVSALDQSYILSVHALFAFTALVCVFRKTTLFAVQPAIPGQRGVPLSSPRVRAVPYLRVISLLLWAGTSILMLHFQIGMMGTSTTYLPYRLAGLVVHTRSIAIPALLVTAELCRLRRGQRISLWFLSCLALFGISDTVFKASKGALLSYLVVGVLLALSNWSRGRRTFSGGHIALVALLALGGIVLSPVVSVYRDAIRGVDQRSGSDLAAAASAARQNMDDSVPAVALSGATTVVARLTGIDQLAVVTSNIDALLWLNWLEVMEDGGVSRYLTYSVYHYPRNFPMGVAHSYLGWWVALFGRVGAVLGGVSLAVVVWALAWVGQRLFPNSLELWETMALTIIISQLLEGTLESAWLPLVVVVASCYLGEVVIRFMSSVNRELRIRPAGCLVSRA